MALSLEDVLAIPEGVDEERLRRMGLLPQPEPAPSIIPSNGPVTIPRMSPVAARPPEPTAEAVYPKQLQALAPQVDPNAVKPMEKPTLLQSPQSSLMGYRSREEARRAGEDLSAPAGAGPTMPTTESGREQVELDRLRDEQKHPWGTPENHPGVVGKIGHVLSRIGNIAGDVVAPATMAIIPGTDLNRREREAGLETRLGAAKKEESEENLQKAEAFAKMHPELAAPGKTPEELTYADLLRQVNPKTGQPYTHEEALQKIESDKAEAKPDTAVQTTERITANDTKLRNDPTSLKPEERDELAQAQRKTAEGKIPEEIRAKIAEAPVPSDKKYPGGYNDPQYHKDLEEWIKSYDKALGETPQAKATAEQRAFANDMRQQMLQLQKDKREDSGRLFAPAIQQQVVQAMGTQQATRRLIDILRPYKEDNTPFESFLKTMEYKFGKAQTDEIGAEIAALNLTSLQQAGTVMKAMGGRTSLPLLAKVMQHTPDPIKDSVKLMVQKMQNIDRATAVFLADADKYGRKSSTELPPESLVPYKAGGGGTAKAGEMEWDAVQGKYIPKKANP